MKLKAGSLVLVPCEVKPGPFADERTVLVVVNGFQWLGFVSESDLKDEKGKMFVRARVASITGKRFTAILPGHGLTSPVFQGETARAKAA